MKFHLSIFCLLFIITSFGQKSVSELLEEMPQGQKGIRHYTRIIKIDSNCAEAYWRRGYEYYRTNQYSLAVPDFTIAIFKDSTFNAATVVADRGLAKEMLGRYEEAIIDFSKAISYSYTQDTTI